MKLALKEHFRTAAGIIPTNIRETVLLRLWTFKNTPLLSWMRPTINELTDQRTSVTIPLSRRTKNHIGSMYFGALACGADVAAAFLAIRQISKSGHKVSLVFKNFEADFLKRPESDVIFTCADGEIIKKLITKAVNTRERVNQTVTVTATCDSELVARFALTLSLKLSSDSEKRG